MAKFRSPRIGSNVIHHVELPSLDRHRARKRALLRRGNVNPHSYAEPALGGTRPVEPSEADHRAVVLQPVAPPEAPPAIVAPSVPRPAALRDSQARHQIQLLERRLVKMARLLDSRDQESRSVGAPDEGVASIYRRVQGLGGLEKEVQKKMALMSNILDENLKLRERVTSASSDAR